MQFGFFTVIYVTKGEVHKANKEVCENLFGWCRHLLSQPNKMKTQSAFVEATQT